MIILHNRTHRVIRRVSPGRNDLCDCESGKKYKRCCLLIRHEDDPSVIAALDKKVAEHKAYLRNQKDEIKT